MKNKSSSIHKPLIVSREKLIEQLRDRLEKVVDFNTPDIVFIEGDIGSGKTTLVEQFLNDISRQRKYLLSRYVALWIM